MASFVEQATLAIKDSSTPQINKLNAALKTLMATASSLNPPPMKIHTGPSLYPPKPKAKPPGG